MAVKLWLAGLPVWLGARATLVPASPLLKVRVGMPPTTFEPWFVRDSSSGEAAGGFAGDCYTELAAIGNFEFEYYFFDNNPAYWMDPESAARQALDDNVIDLHFASGPPSPDYLATLPLINYPLVALTKKIKAPPSMWQVFAPFQTELWIAIVISIVFGALVMFLLTSIASVETVGLHCLHGLPDFLYHTAAALLGGDEYDLYHIPHIGRLYRLGLLFFVMISSATYTANLAAYLTKPNFIVLGPQNMKQLMETNKVCNRWYPAPIVDRQILSDSQMIFPPAGMTSLSERLIWARELLQKGECDAIIEAQSTGIFEALRHCSTMSVAPNIRFGYSNLYHILRPNDTEIVSRLNTAVTQFITTTRYTELEEEYLGIGRSCSDESSGDDELDGSQISLRQMSAVFIVFGACSVLSIIIVTAQRIRNRGPVSQEAEEVQNEKLDTHLNLMDQKIDKLAQMDHKLDRILAQFGTADTAAVINV